MPYVPLTIPPGMTRPGTVYDARGRWYDGNLVRWYEGALQPVGGWSQLQDGGSPAQLTGGPPRGMVAWRDNVQQPTLAAGTAGKLWLYRAGVLADVTPATFTAGPVDADIVSGQYGAGKYSGAGNVYGSGVAGVGLVEDATSWQLDTFGQALIACAVHDNRLLWKIDPSTSDLAVAIPNAPTARAVVVTPERFVVALGAYDTTLSAINDRLVAWSDQEDPELWAPADTNQAGDFMLTTPGRIMAGRRTSQETLIWTDVDLWRMRFIGGVFVYSITMVASTGAVSRHAMTVIDGKAYWMGPRTFYVYDGYARALPCEVADYVFNDFNEYQASKVVCYPRAQFGEVTWHYPSAGSTEVDRYVTLNVVTGAWTLGELERTAGVDGAVYGFPIAADASGNVYQHEVEGGEYDVNGSALVPYIESGPLEIGQGDQVMMVRQIIPDMVGAVEARIMSSIFPITAETTHGPFTLSSPTPVRLTGRQVRVRFEGSGIWRIGTMRLEIVPGGLR